MRENLKESEIVSSTPLIILSPLSLRCTVPFTNLFAAKSDSLHATRGYFFEHRRIAFPYANHFASTFLLNS